MKAKLFEVKETKDKGKGLFAKEHIPKGTITWFKCAKCKTYTKSSIENLKGKEKEFVYWHAYKIKTGKYILPCDEASYTNHSCNANILNSGKGFDIVVKDIRKGEEATYDYRTFYDIKMKCNCGENNCCKIVRSKYPIPIDLNKYWRKKIKPSLKQVKRVHQPLKKYLIRSENFSKIIE